MVLVVDDDEDSRDGLVRALTDAGITAVGAASAAEALDVFTSLEPGLVVVDYVLPDRTGVELARRLKERRADVPVLLLTGHASLATAAATVGQVDGYLLKPVAAEALVQAVRRTLSHAALVAENTRLTDRLERLSAYPALYDPLTGLPNRALLEDRLDQAVAASRRNFTSVALLFIDLDGFKTANDLFGHHVGDQLLREVADRLAGARRKTDTVARFGGDEFVVVCPDMESDADACRIAETVLQELERPVRIGAVEHRLSASIGVVVRAPGEGEDTPDALLRDADLAMYGAKEEGRSCWKLFDEAMRERVVARSDIEDGLRAAIDRDEFSLLYQPVVDLQTGVIAGAEALLRWHRPGRGTVLPTQFLRVADELGLSIAIGTWVLEHALSDLARFATTVSLPPSFRLWVNVSASQLVSSRFADTVDELTRAHGFAPTVLGVDVAEQTVGEVVAGANELHALRELGVAIDVDDFGSGQSNLAWLRELPITGLKIDGELVAGLEYTEDSRGPAIVRGLVGLGHELRLSIFGEGIESEAQAVALRAMGCEYAQGYFFARPGPLEELQPIA